MKRGPLILFITTFLIQFTSAQFLGGSRRFSIGSFFSNIDSSTIILGLLFFIFFALIFYALSRVFKGPDGLPNKGIAGTISFAVSLLIIYGIYRSGFNLENFLFIPSEFVPMIMVLFAILIIWSLGKRKDEFGNKSFSLKKGLGGFFILFGLLMALLTIATDIFYEGFTAFIIGIVFFLIGLWLSKKRGRRSTGYGNYDDYGSSRGPGMFKRMRGRRRDIKDIKHGQRVNYEGQRAEKQYQRKLNKETRRERKEREKLERKEKRGQMQPLEPTRELRRRTKKRKVQQQELTERQKKREKGRKSGLRQINQQAKIIDRQLRNQNISDESRKILRQRINDLENRRRILKSYGIGKGNI